MSSKNIKICNVHAVYTVNLQYCILNPILILLKIIFLLYHPFTEVRGVQDSV
jgi:hypothetical protein